MEEFLSIKEVADYLRVDYKTIYRLVQQGEIPAGKVGGVYRIRRQDLDAYFERQQQALAQQAAKAAQLKCGRCLRLLLPHEVAGTCEAPDCEEPLCRTCWADDPDHRCRMHVLSREARLRQAQAQLAQGEVPLLLTSEEAHRCELLYMSRLEAKLRDLEAIPHPLTGRSVRVADWDAIETRVQESDRFREASLGYLDKAESSPLPTNPRRTYRLARDMVLEVAVYSDLAAHFKQGFVTQPTSVAKLFDLLIEAIGRAEAEDSLTVLGLAATAGWDGDAAALVQGNEAGQRPFHHRLVAPVLVDLARDRLVFNYADGRLDQIAPLLSPEMAMDMVQEVMIVVETLLAGRRTGVSMSEMVARYQASVAEVTAAFDRLAASGAYRVEDENRDQWIYRRSI